MNGFYPFAESLFYYIEANTVSLARFEPQMSPVRPPNHLYPPPTAARLFQCPSFTYKKPGDIACRPAKTCIKCFYNGELRAQKLRVGAGYLVPAKAYAKSSKSGNLRAKKLRVGAGYSRFGKTCAKSPSPAIYAPKDFAWALDIHVLARLASSREEPAYKKYVL